MSETHTVRIRLDPATWQEIDQVASFIVKLWTHPDQTHGTRAIYALTDMNKQEACRVICAASSRMSSSYRAEFFQALDGLAEERCSYAFQQALKGEDGPYGTKAGPVVDHQT